MSLKPSRLLQQLPFCCLLSFLAAAVAAGQNSSCADGIIRSAKGNEQIQICNIVAQRDPELTAQLDAALKLLGDQKAQISRLVSAVNAVGKNLDPMRQARMVQSLVEKLQSSPGAAPQRAEHLATDLTSLNADIQGMQADPTAAALTRARLEGSLGDAVSQLDVSEAKADLADIRATLNRIEAQTKHIATTTDTTQKDVTAINKQMNVLMASVDPARVLPPDEAKLYTDLSPIAMECTIMATRWTQADNAAMRSRTQAATQQRVVAESPFQQDIASGMAPIVAHYGSDLQPRLEAWRLELVQRAPSLSTELEFKPPVLNVTGNETLMRRAYGQVVTLLSKYPKADPSPSPELIDEGKRLKAELQDLRPKLSAVHRTADEAEFERRNAARPAAPAAAAKASLMENVEPDVDPAFQKEFTTTLQPKMQAWLQGMTKLVPVHEGVDFSQAINGMTMQQKVCSQFARSMLPFNQKVMADLRAAAAAAR